jgi:drug/metabolite transporter (DMT)-like permease
VASGVAAETTGAGAPSQARVALALGTIYVVWGSTYLGIRWVVAELPPFAAGTIRFFSAGLCFFLLGVLRPGGLASLRATSWRQVRNAALIGAAMLGCSNGLVGLAERDISSGMTALMIAITPLLIALMEALRPGGTRPGARASAGLVVGFVGTALLVTGGRDDGHATSAAGVVMVLVAAVVWAAATLAARDVPRPAASMISAGIEMMAGGVTQAVVAAFRGDWPQLFASDASARAWLSLLYLAAVGSCLGYGAFSWLTRNARPTLVSTYGYVNPLVAVTLGTLLAGEALGPRIAVAGVAVVGAVFLVSTDRSKRAGRA